MHVLVVTTNFRNADNWLELFDRIVTEGGRCELISLPWTGDPSVDRFVELEARFPVRVRRPLQWLSADDLGEEELDGLLQDACADGSVDVVFLCDMQSYPSTAVHRLLQRLPCRPPRVVGLQHGLFQSWWLYDANFCADQLLAFGDRHIACLDPAHRSKAVAVGLPKLDRLLGVATAPAGYVAHLAQRFLPPETLAPAFSALAAHMGLKVVGREHPQYPGTDRAGADAASADYVQFLARCDWALTGYSTGGIEALYLGKPVVLLPSFGLTAWLGYPGIARDLSVAEIVGALGRIQTYRTAVDRFIGETVGGLRFDHTDRAWHALLRLLDPSPASTRAVS